MNGFPERDWKLLRELKPVALERFCARVLQQAVRIAQATDLSNHERYGTLYGMIHDEDRKLARAFDNLRRSSALMQLTEMYSLGLFTPEELARFSEPTRERVIPLAR